MSSWVPDYSLLLHIQLFLLTVCLPQTEQQSPSDFFTSSLSRSLVSNFYLISQLALLGALIAPKASPTFGDLIPMINSIFHNIKPFYFSSSGLTLTHSPLLPTDLCLTYHHFKTHFKFHFLMNPFLSDTVFSSETSECFTIYLLLAIYSHPVPNMTQVVL